MDGFRKFAYDCDKQGCFNKKHRLDFGQFYDVLPGKISFTDVDGVTEVGGFFLFLEWKNGGALGAGQRIMFERLTRACSHIVVAIVEGSAGDETTVKRLCVIRDGKIGQWESASLHDLRERIRGWGIAAQTKSTIEKKASFARRARATGAPLYQDAQRAKDMLRNGGAA